MPFYKNIIFDTGGALWDSSSGVIATYKELVKIVRDAHKKEPRRYPLVREFSEEEYRGFCGPSLDVNLEKIFPDSRSFRPTAHNIYRLLYDTPEIQESIKLYEGIPEMLEELNRDGRRVYVLTEKAGPVADKILRFHGVRQLFKAVQGTAFEGETATREELFMRLILSEAKKGAFIEPSETVYVTSRVKSALPALNLGIEVVEASWGNNLPYEHPEKEAVEKAVLKKFHRSGSSGSPSVFRDFLRGFREEFDLPFRKAARIPDCSL